MGTDKVLSLIAGYRNETNYTVWENLTGHIADLNRLLSHTDFHSQFKTFAVGLFHDVVARLGWEPKPNEQPLDSMLRGLVLAAHGNYGNQDTLRKAKEMFEAHCVSCEKNEPSPVLADLRGVVYQLAMRQGDMKTFDKIFEVCHIVSCVCVHACTVCCTLMFVSVCICIHLLLYVCMVLGVQ